MQSPSKQRRLLVPTRIGDCSMTRQESPGNSNPPCTTANTRARIANDIHVPGDENARARAHTHTHTTYATYATYAIRHNTTQHNIHDNITIACLHVHASSFIRYTRGGGGAGGRIDAEYLCPAKGTKLSSEWEITSCHATLKKGGSASKTHTFTTAECGGKRPEKPEECFASISQRQQSGSDEDWYLKSGSSSLSFGWWCSGCSANINFKVDYICPKKPSTLWKVYHCKATVSHKVTKEATLDGYYHGYNLYRWTAADCGGKLPTGKCFSSYRSGSHSGQDEDFQVNSPSDPEGASMSWHNPSSGAAANIAADYLCIPQSAIGPLKRAKPNLALEKKQLTTCSWGVTYKKSSGSGYSYTYTAKDCGGSLAFQNKDCAVGIKSASHCGGDEDWRAYLKPPKMTWYVRGNSCAGGTAAVNYLCPSYKSDLSENWRIIHCKSTIKTSSGASKKHTFTMAECGNEYIRDITKCAVIARERSQSGSDEDWMIHPGKSALTSTWWCSGCTANINLAVDCKCLFSMYWCLQLFSLSFSAYA